MAKTKTPTKKGTKITAEAIGGISFLYTPQPAQGRTPCITGCGGHIIRHDDKPEHINGYYTCDNSKCKWISIPLSHDRPKAKGKS